LSSSERPWSLHCHVEQRLEDVAYGQPVETWGRDFETICEATRRENVAPTQPVLAVRISEGGRETPL
jgi:hypothetical protein